MTDPRHDQIDAATADTARLVHDTLAPGATRLDGNAPLRDALTQRLIGRYTGHPRCEHLRAVPVQPQIYARTLGTWLCQACADTPTADGTSPLPPLDSRLCDGCLTPRTGPIAFFIASYMLFTVVAVLCPTCHTAIRTEGGHDE